MGNGRRFSVLHNKTAGCVRKASTQLPLVSKKPIPFAVIVDHHPSLGYSAHAAGEKRQTGVISQNALYEEHRDSSTTTPVSANGHRVDEGGPSEHIGVQAVLLAHLMVRHIMTPVAWCLRTFSGATS